MKEKRQSRGNRFSRELSKILVNHVSALPKEEQEKRVADFERAVIKITSSSTPSGISRTQSIRLEAQSRE